MTPDPIIEQLPLRIMRPPPTFRRVEKALLLSAATVSGVGIWFEGLDAARWLLPLSFLVAFGLIILIRRRRPPKGTLADIVFRQETVLLPGASPFSGKDLELPYAQLEGISRLERPHGTILVIDRLRELPIYLGELRFFPRDGLGRLHAELLRKLAALPDGPKRLIAMERRDALRAELEARPSLVTRVTISLLLVAFALETSVTGEPLGLVRIGANVPLLVAKGEVWRLVTANFLHAGLLHLGMNCLGLLVLGPRIERMLGAARTIVLLVVSGVAGAAASYYGPRLGVGSLQSVGVSTAVFGLLGAMGAVQLRFGDALPSLYRFPRRLWGVILLVDGGLSALLPGIDGWAHLGGFAAGFLLAVLLLGDDDIADAARPEPVARGLAAACVLICVLSIGQAADAARRWEMGAELNLLLEAAQEMDLHYNMLNELAWSVAEEPNATRQQLEAARTAAERALKAAPTSAHILDTLATLQHRLGEAQAAVDGAMRAFAQEPRPFMATQLARFLLTRLERVGPAPGSEDLRLTRITDALQVRAERWPEQGRHVFAVVERSAGPQLLRFCARSGTHSLSWSGADPPPREAPLRVAAFEEGCEAAPPVGSVEVHYQDAISLALPGPQR